MMKLFFLFVLTICKISSAHELTNTQDIPDVRQRITDCVRGENALTGGLEIICLESYVRNLELSVKVEAALEKFELIQNETKAQQEEHKRELAVVLDKLELIQNVTKAYQAEHKSVECTPPFEVIGDRCIFVDNINSGTWTEMKSLCERLGGNMIKLDDVNLLYDIGQYIKARGWVKTNYWIGATDEGHEGYWTWTDGSSVQMGTPFWANWEASNRQAPEGGSNQNCAVIDGKSYYFLNDLPCSSKYKTICEASVVLSD